MGDVIPPIIQVPQVSYSLWVPWRRASKVEQDSKAFEVITNVLDNRVAAIERQPGCKLRLDRRLQCDRSGRRAELSALGV
jgi:hypothetical protein